VSSNVKLINRRNFASLYEVTCLNLNPIAGGFQTFPRITSRRMLIRSSSGDVSFPISRPKDRSW
jgi:hypothetical protein